MVSSDSKDSRTNLPDRESFYLQISPMLAKESSVVLLSVELEGLSFVLRTFGPEKRDSVIRDVGRRIREVAGGHTPYHISQDCFALPLVKSSYQQSIDLAERLCGMFKKTFDVDGVAYRLNAHIGISHFPNHGKTSSELVRTSAFACHLARENRSDYATFDHNLDERERERFRLMVDLEQALKNNEEIELMYQPIVDLTTGQCRGMEGLCRWKHPELGQIAPGNFLPYVEHTSLIMPLTETTLSLGLENLAAWLKKGFQGSLSINLSPALFKYPDLLERLIEQFRFANVSPERVHFEITETGIMEQPAKAIHTLGAIRDWGSRISVDDFGTGHSSLAYLADLPIDIIKIDKRFIQNLDLPWGEAIVGAAAVLGDKLGLITVGEGIETENQLQTCRNLGVTFGQGFYLGRPMSRQAFGKWIEKNERGAISM